MATPKEKREELAPLLLDVPAAPAPEEPAILPDDQPTARQRIAALIERDNPNIKAYPWVFLPEQVTLGQPVASVYRSKLSNATQANVLRHDVTIDLYVALTDGLGAEAEAEDALDAVLLTLQRAAGVTWSEAERVNFGEDFAGYKITTSMVSKDQYLQAVLAENAG